MTKSTITREESVQAVFDLKVGYPLGLADIEILKRVARMALAAMGSEPVAWMYNNDDRSTPAITVSKKIGQYWVAEFEDVQPLYRHAQPAPEYPEVLPCSVLLEPGLRFGKGIKTSTMLAALARRAVYESDMAALSPEEIADFQTRIEEFKALIAQPAPVVPDGYVMVPMRLTAENGAKGALSGEFSETKFVNCPECFGDDECETCDGSGRIEITVPVTWTTIKEIWAKGVEHFAAAPQSPGSEPATVPGKWIPVSERMPESNGMYFGWDGKRVLEVYCFFGGFSANQFIHGEITHWMPLPAAPQEVNHG
ncbi:DUF551 domain-containing protein [Klebsiella pneumoniae]